MSPQDPKRDPNDPAPREPLSDSEKLSGKGSGEEEIHRRLDAHEVYHVAQEHRIWEVIKNFWRYGLGQGKDADKHPAKRWPSVRAFIFWFLFSSGGGGGITLTAFVFSLVTVLQQCESNRIGEEGLVIGQDGNEISFVESRIIQNSAADELCEQLIDYATGQEKDNADCIQILNRVQRKSKTWTSFAASSPNYDQRKSQYSKLEQKRKSTIEARGLAFECVANIQRWSPSFADVTQNIKFDHMYLADVHRIDGHEKSLEELVIDGSYIKDVTITNLDMPLLNAQHCIFENVHFANCDLSGVDFSGSIFFKTDFTKTTLISGIFDQTSFYGAINLGDPGLSKGATFEGRQNYSVEEYRVQME